MTIDELTFVLSSRAAWPTSGASNTDPGDLNMESLMSNAQYGEDGYLNVASAVGLSGERDHSTYNSFWVRRHLGRGRYGGYGSYGRYGGYYE